MYTPYAQNNSVANSISLVVRTGRRDPLGAIPAVKAAVWAVAATLTKLFPEIGRGGLLYVTGATLALLACGAASAMLAARTVARLDPAAALRGD